ncbi:MAG: lysostaphin resistance A-like protein [bacterium]
MQTAKQTLSIGQAIWLLLLTVGLMLSLGVGLGLLTASYDVALVLHPGAMAAVQVLAIGVILIWGAISGRMSLENVFPLRALRSSVLLPIIPTVIGASILLSEADNVLRLVLPMPEAMTYVLSSLVGGEGKLWWSALAVVVVAPLAEEFLFRGLILNNFLSRYSVRKSIVASALLFGAFHLNPWQFAGGTIAGLLFGWWFVRTRSLIPCIVGHAMYNGLPLILIGIFQVNVPGYTGSVAGLAFQPAWFTVSGLVLAGVGVAMMVRAFTRTAENNALVSRQGLQET